VADSGNSVYIAEHPQARFILRLTNPTYRSRAECTGELAFINHLAACGCRVSRPIPSRNAELTEEVCEGSAVVIASLFRWAPGILVSPGERFWNRSFFEEWGRSLGELHQAARSFSPPGSAERWEWQDEILIQKRSQLIPADEPDVRDRLDDVIHDVLSLDRDATTYGMTHGDFAPQNFRFDPLNGITSFDFGNCCRHFFASDVAIAFTALRRQPDDAQQAARTAILDGYRQATTFTREQERTLPLMHSLRVHYVYLSRLYKFGPNPSDDDRKTLDALREWVRREG